jgi:nicotinamide-nucleotide amidase
VNTTILAVPGEIQIHLRTWTDDEQHANATLDELVRSIELALGDRIFAHAALSLEQVVAQLLIDNHASIAAAESCTGGLLAERLTRIPGSSNYFLGGAVCYSNEMKTAWADVTQELIASKGAVSSEVAIALAEGIRRRVRSTLGVGITGIAGPGGGSEEKPVGTVHVALAAPNATKERAVHLPGDREAIRFYASQIALDMVRVHFLFQPPVTPSRKPAT